MRLRRRPSLNESSPPDPQLGLAILLFVGAAQEVSGTEDGRFDHARSSPGRRPGESIAGLAVSIPTLASGVSPPYSPNT
jgi:hypothetical protein